MDRAPRSGAALLPNPINSRRRKTQQKRGSSRKREEAARGKKKRGSQQRPATILSPSLFHLASPALFPPLHPHPRAHVPLLSPLPREDRALVRRTARAGFRREVAPTFSSSTLFLGRGRLCARAGVGTCTRLPGQTRGRVAVAAVFWCRLRGRGRRTDHERAEVVAAHGGGAVRWSRHDAAMPSVAGPGRTAP